MKTAVVYCRVSTEDQEREGTSLQSQLETCRKKARELGYEVSDNHIINEIWSGVDLDRPNLNRARELIRTRAVSALICYATDRLARNPIHIGIIAEECEKRGIELIFVTEPSDNSPEGHLIRYVKGYAAEIEREKILDRTMRGKKTRAEKGMLPTGGLNLYGYTYDPDTGKRKINEYEAGVVQTMFGWLIEDRVSCNEIRRKLAKAGIPAPKGGSTWGRTTVGRILRNAVYTGETYANRMISMPPKNGDTDGRRCKKPRRQLRPKSDWILLPDASPAIISKETFEEAQRQLGVNRDLAPRTQKYHWPLRGFVWCKRCGRRYHGNPQHGYRVYRCSSRTRLVSPASCGNRHVNADFLETEVWNKVKAVLSDPDLVIAELRRKRELNLEAEHLKEEVELNRKRLQTLDEAETRIIRLHAYAGRSEEKTLNELNRVNAERERIEQANTELDKRIRETRQIELNEATIKRFCELVGENIENFTSEQKNLALEALQVKVWIDGNSVAIEGSIPLIPNGELMTQQSS
jgi:site-specific DNA recombinase